VSLFKYSNNSIKLWSQVACVVAVPEGGRVGSGIFSSESFFFANIVIF